MNQTANPVAVKSKKWIMEALVELMNQKNFQEITVSELVLKADVGRRTFYRNFSSKEDVLESYLDIIISELVFCLDAKDTLTSEFCLYQIFLLCKANQSFLNGLYKSNMLFFLLEKWNIMLPVIHEQVADKIPDFPLQSDDKNLTYMLSFNVGGIWNIISGWVSNGMTESPKYLTEVTMDLIQF